MTYTLTALDQKDFSSHFEDILGSGDNDLAFLTPRSARGHRSQSMLVSTKASDKEGTSMKRFFEAETEGEFPSGEKRR